MKFKFITSLLVAFFIGISSSPLFFSIPFKETTFTTYMDKKISQWLNLNTSPEFKLLDSIKSSRYSLNLYTKFPEEGTFQLAKLDSQNIFILERFTGQSYIWNIYTGKIQINRNLLADLNLLNQKSKMQVLQVADVHYAFNKLFFSVVSDHSHPECLDLSAYSADISPKSKSQPVLIFRSPCIEDLLNPALFGGRFTNSKTSLFMSVGEQRYDRSGFPKNSKIAKQEIVNDKSVFGKILIFNQSISDYRIYSSGHRNAQGLFYSETNSLLFEAEHGPQGGDEVNVIQEGKNYGWPFVSFGTAYGWALGSNFPDPSTVKGTNYEEILKSYGQIRGSHKDFAKPLFSWFPSIGAGSIYEVANNSDLIDWRKNLLVVSLAKNQVHRLILEQNKVIIAP